MTAAAIATPLPGGALGWGIQTLTPEEALDIRAGESIAYWLGYAAGYATGAIVEAIVIGRICRRLGGLC